MRDRVRNGAVDAVLFRLTRAARWEAGGRAPVEITGLRGCRALFGLDGA